MLIFCSQVMDSDFVRDGRLIDIVDLAWIQDTLPDEDILVPQMELPELDLENNGPLESLKEQEQKWNDLALHTMQEL